MQGDFGSDFGGGFVGACDGSNTMDQVVVVGGGRDVHPNTTIQKINSLVRAHMSKLCPWLL